MPIPIPLLYNLIPIPIPILESASLLSHPAHRHRPRLAPHTHTPQSLGCQCSAAARGESKVVIESRKSYQYVNPRYVWTWQVFPVIESKVAIGSQFALRRTGPSVALLVSRYLSNTASFVFYGIACLTWLIEFAALFATFEESVCYNM